MPTIPSLVLTNQYPINTYTASVITSGSNVISDGLGNQLTFLQLTASYASSSVSASGDVSASSMVGGVTKTIYVVSASGATNYVTMSFVNGILVSSTP